MGEGGVKLLQTPVKEFSAAASQGGGAAREPDPSAARRRRGSRPSMTASPAKISAMPASAMREMRSPRVSVPSSRAVIGTRKVTRRTLVGPEKGRTEGRGRVGQYGE